MTRKIVFLCEFGGPKGWGHLTRCVAMAQEAGGRGWCTALVGSGTLAGLPQEAKEAFGSAVGDCDWITELPPEAVSATVVFVDEMYQHDESLHRIRRQFLGEQKTGKLIIGTDDMQRRRMDAVDIVVNSEIQLFESSYAPCVQSLLGEKYSMLRRPFSRVNRCPSLSGKTSVFVMMGGTDPFGLNLRAVESLDRDFCIPNVVVGESYRHRSELEGLLSEFGESTLSQALSGREVVECMGASNYGIIACGTSSLELGALQLPFVGLSIIDNQTATARKIAKNWRLPILHCEEREVQAAEIREKFEELLADFPRDRSKRFGEVDGLGCSRIMDVCERVLRLT